MKDVFRTLGRVLVVFGTAALLTGAAWAFINPDFTPLNLIESSDAILVVQVSPEKVTDKGMATATVKEVIKAKEGDKPKELQIDLMASAFPAQGKEVIDKIKGGVKDAMFFSGVFRVGGAGDQPAEDTVRGFLHLGGKWYVLSPGKNEGEWDLDKKDEYLLGTWAGSTDKLYLCVKYILTDKFPEVPIAANVEWADPVEFSKMQGNVSAAAPVDVLGKGQTDLFLACDAGDRLYRWDGKAMQDLTAKSGLASKSQAFAWGDFDGDGRIDLASWDGKALTLLAQKAEGTFTARAWDTGAALKEGCVSLAAVGGPNGKAALLAGTKTWPVLLVPQADGALQAKPLGTGDFPGKQFGDGGKCLVADIDDDGLTDVLQLFPKGSTFYKGTAPGAFAAPIRTAVAVGPSPYSACLGDFDGDGQQDVFVAGDLRNSLYQNLGGAKFDDLLEESGEIAYISKNGGIATAAGDFCNSGRLGILLAYGTKMAPHLFFNRGWRCTGHARDLDLSEKHLCEASAEGQQAACLGDFNGDGALDMVLVLKQGGALWLFPRKVDEGGATGVVVRLPVTASQAGPVNVTAWRDDRKLGAWTVAGGDGGQIIGARKGKITLKWRWAGETKEQEKKVDVKIGPARVALDQK